MKWLIYLYDDAEGRGGAETIVHMVAREILRQGNDVYVFFLNPRKYKEWDEEEMTHLHLVYTKTKGILRFLQLIKNFWRYRNEQFDYSFTSLVDTNGVIGLMRRLKILRIKKTVGRESTSIFARYHGFALWRKQMMYHLGYPQIDLLVCQSNKMKEELLDNLPWLTRKCEVVVVPNPFDNALAQQMGAVKMDVVDKCGDYIVTAGRFISAKAYDVLLESFAILHKEWPQMKLIMLGEGNLRPRYEEIIDREGLNEYVLFPGFTDNVYPYFRGAKLCVVSSRIEGFPNVLLQMMSQNDKVVSTLCAGGIEHIKGLFTCEVNNVELLAKTMSKCLKADTSRCRELFDNELMSRSLEHFIECVFR